MRGRAGHRPTLFSELAWGALTEGLPSGAPGQSIRATYELISERAGFQGPLNGGQLFHHRDRLHRKQSRHRRWGKPSARRRGEVQALEDQKKGIPRPNDQRPGEKGTV